MKNSIKLHTESVLQVPFQNYKKDFTFIVNSERFDTSTIAADLLSPTISRLHLNDPTIQEFYINTESRGNFKHILNLLTFEEEEILEDEIPFLLEILDHLGIERIDPNITYEEEEISNSNIFIRLSKHQKHRNIFCTQLEKDVEFFTTHFHELKDQIITQIENRQFDIEDTVFERIISNKNLQLESEGDLLEVVNKLYSSDSKYSNLYEFVDFIYLEKSEMNEFLSIFDTEDMTRSTWKSIVARLQQEIVIVNDESEDRKKHESAKQKTFFADLESKDNEFNGILNHLRTHGNIKDEINISCSSNCDGTDPFTIVKYEDTSGSSYLYTNDTPNSWICIEFKNHEVIPSSYIIRSYNWEDNDHLKTWVIEGSNDKETWKTLDSQTNNDILNGARRVHLFPISTSKNQNQSFKYLRLKQTGPNWLGHNHLLINSIEFYGQII